MFPNPQDALPLAPRPNIEQYKKQAKDLVKACKSDDSDTIHLWAKHWVETLARLADLKISRELPVRLDRWVEEVADFARRRLRGSGSGKATCSLAEAQFVIARSHGFESWPKFRKHIDGLAHTRSPVSNYESAADAVVAGDIPALERLLHQDPALIQTRSTREHRATLLHYVSANGVEGFRQRTAKNVVKVAELLLEAGAEVDATANLYGGGATPLGLVATSIHPERAGVQEALLKVLLRHGAAIDPPRSDPPIVNVCLANGRGPAAEFLARRGARLNLEAAAGVGDLNAVKSFFRDDGALEPGATKWQMERGFLWACEYGRLNVVEFLFQKGVDLKAQANTGQTALHWAVIGGQLETIQLLINRGASLEAKNEYEGTALGQALWSAINGDPGIDSVRTVEALLVAGARIEDGSLAWLARQDGGSSSVKQRIGEILCRYGAKS